MASVGPAIIYTRPWIMFNVRKVRIMFRQSHSVAKFIKLTDTLMCTFCSSLPLISRSAMTSAAMKASAENPIPSVRWYRPTHAYSLQRLTLIYFKHARMPRVVHCLSLDLSRLIKFARLKFCNFSFFKH